MARVTVEDCVTKIPNRFELVMKSAQRARNIASGSALSIERDNDKNPVVALREIADETTSLEELEAQLVKGLQHFIEADEPEEETMDTDAIQRELMSETGAADVHEEIQADALTVETQEHEFSMNIGGDEQEAETVAALGDEGSMMAVSPAEQEAEMSSDEAPPSVDESVFAGASFAQNEHS